MQERINEFIKSALLEDFGVGDITSNSIIDERQTGEAICYVKEDCILAGVELAKMICYQVDPLLVVDFIVNDGDAIRAVASIGKIQGSIKSILKLERLLLNCMQRMSAIASKTHHYVTLVAPYSVKVLDTRKTTPNFRVCEKWAVKIGGGVNHRFGLFDQILIKDNHIRAAGGIQNSLELCKKYFEKNLSYIPVVVEVKKKHEFNIAKNYDFVDRILLDNMRPNDIIELLKFNDKQKAIEASGGINEKNLIEYAKTGIDYISIGDLTHHVNAVDISLKIV